MAPPKVSLRIPEAKGLTATHLAATLLLQADPKAIRIDIKRDPEAKEIIIDEKECSDAEGVKVILGKSDRVNALMAKAEHESLVKIPDNIKDRGIMPALGRLNKHLQFKTYMEGYALSSIDLLQFVALMNPIQCDVFLLPGRGQFPHVVRWLDYIAAQPFSVSALSTIVDNADTPAVSHSKPQKGAAAAHTSPEEKLAEMEASYANKLTGAEMGKVVTRFPPEPSGYLHIGHAKAALINSFYARYFKGKLLIRFDDTNPTKEKAEFEQSIIEDLALLGVHGEGPSYTSDYLPQLQEACHKLIEMGKGYVDDTPSELMRQQRFDGIESSCRNLPVEENLRRWKEMLAGSPEGLTMCVRAKIDMSDPNKCMRDPVFYRTNVETPHHRTGTTYKAYPTYDFACPLVDSWSGVTHALRTNEYADRIPQYYWVQDTMGVRRTIVYEFSRLNFTNTVLSKRKLTWLVESGVVEGWDDPRFPTVRGLIRRGLQIQALHEFLIEQGPSKNSNMMEWDKLWSKNARVLDNITPRYMAVSSEGRVEVSLTDLSEPLTKERPVHPKVPSMGTLPMVLTPVILLDGEDLKDCSDSEEITLVRYGNVVLDEITRGEGGVVLSVKAHSHLEGDVKKTKKKLHWIPKSENNYPFIMREFDHIITKRKPEEGDEMKDIANFNSVFDTTCLGEPEMKNLKEGDLLQIERRGYCRVDKMHDGVPVLIKIPDGKMKAMSTLATKVDSASLVKGTGK
eukprot:Blabericola_migrator_1__13407@NODE_959_length_5893_cov_215_544113_g665_i0_p1_GENE_NODE_959_length_5893_cov_215_544113_g665_i0NODE_959_length_5893_cov_215_544113_g665_i0_p1_ORF_typecomplete_len737_score165_94tRNAsynt_1c/PF00749_21/1_5e81tRNAsynt_1c_C/PF03950_18/3_5e34GST_C/PF00043_25/0_00034tRNAsynt_1/PF00133_22/0_1_NODE_959_length_5893_cov_215_544113_g665_i014873697